ncbi:MAG TPA: SDR family NAD(P)-dependent oxidoreductase [Victivallales bacterium]|nr:SDR family NAD(P)-dependent oxidoreductase [Victivallales bacterium]
MTKSVPDHSNSIAVVGMACVFPGAHSPEELFENILAGRRYFRKSPKERLPSEDYYDPDPLAPGKTYTDLMSVITDWTFDPLDYRIPPVTYNATDLAHWLALYTSKVAIENANLPLEKIDLTRVGVVLGNSLTGEFSRSHYLRFRWPYVERCLRKTLISSPSNYIESMIDAFKKIYNAPLPEITEDSLAGNMSNTIAGRICNYFDFGAGGFTIDGACSSALLSTVNACNALIDNEMDVVVTGGVDISLDPFEIVGFAKTKALAQEDIRPYDTQPNGMLTGEGCGMFILMSEEKARAEGYQIHALIKGWGYSSDGGGTGITAPVVEGQMRALSKAYEKAGYPITSVGLFEGHGTGTPVGDKVEISAIRRLMEEAGESENIAKIGSIKANIGHCKAAAGAAGLVKAIMSVKEKIIPPTINCNRPNFIFGEPLTNLEPAINGGIWNSDNEPRRVSVSAMGFGGSNSHVTLEEAYPDKKINDKYLNIVGSQRTSEIIFLAGKTVKGILAQIDKMIPVVKRISIAELTDLSVALANKKINGKYRIAIVIDSPWKLSDILADLREMLSGGKTIEDCNLPSKGIFAGKTVSKPKIVGLFPGQGAQRINMGKDLKYSIRKCEDFYNRLDDSIKDILGGKLSDKVFHNIFRLDRAEQEKLKKELSKTNITQPSIVASSMAVLKFLEFLGIIPDICIGHSLGEISACAAAGAFNAEDAVKIAALRGRAMGDLEVDDPGSMLAVVASASEVEKLISQCEGYAIVSNFNSNNQSVVSGEANTIDHLKSICDEKKIRSVKLNVSHAFHSEITAPAAKQFAKDLTGFTFNKLKKTVMSTSLGDEIDDKVNLKNLLSEHIRKPVRFYTAVKKLESENPDLWLEIGPGGILSGLVNSITGNKKVECYQTDLDGENGFDLIHKVIAKAFVLGIPVKTENLYADRFHRKFDLDNYNPIFITNPCEREVDIDDAPVNLGEISLPSGMLPDEANSIQFQNYLSERGSFINDFISLDYKHFNNVSQMGDVALQNENDDKKKITESKPEVNDDINIMDYAIEWISNRTGFPKSSILPEMKLRDDLNLDSIKVGELVVNICQKLNKETPADPAVFSNSNLIFLISTVQNDFNAGEESGIRVQTSGHVTTTNFAVNNIEDWVRTFQIDRINSPIENEKMLHLPHYGSLLIVGDSNAKEVIEMGTRFSKKGIKTNILSFEEAENSIEIDNVAILLIIYRAEKYSSVDCSPEKFNELLQKRALGLLKIFRNIGDDRDAAWKNLRTVIASPYNEMQDSSIDAGKAFLKSCKLEHSALHAKWLELPESWNSAKFSNVVEQELQTTGIRVVYHYDSDGDRYSEAAYPLQVSDGRGLKLSSDDVVLFTGAAQGITFELAREFALKYGVKIVLTGRSDMPKFSDDPENEMVKNFKRLEEDKIKYKYLKFDIRDLDLLKDSVIEIENEMGKITGVVHGAGVSQLKLLHDMDETTFMRTINVKAQGFYNILHCIPAAQLKLLHVISSVLGKTGMRGQTDYTFANAWIDGALETVRRSNPSLHCISIGYSVWKDVGLGKKLGVVDKLRSTGVTSIETEDGINSYLDLCDSSHPVSTFIVTGQLGVNIEEYLFPEVPKTNSRFTEKIVRWIPKTEVISEIELSFDQDLYLQEHIFEGTIVYPAVMILEGFTEAAKICTDIDEIPALRDAVFNKPLIIPENKSIVTRIFAVAEKPALDGSIKVKLQMKSELDKFSSTYSEANCIFYSNDIEKKYLPEFPELDKPLDVIPENFYPDVLFQGKFFRRISDIYKMEKEKSCITALEVPANEEYFENRKLKTALPYPALRDSLLQTGLLILPNGSLPAEINNIDIYQNAEPGTKVICHIKIREKLENGYRSDLAVYTKDGALVESICDVVSLTPQKGSESNRVKAQKPSSIKNLNEELAALLEQKQELVFVHHSVVNSENITEVSDEEISEIRGKVSELRQTSAICNLIAVRRAAVNFAKKYADYDLNFEEIQIEHDAAGKPELHILNSNVPRDLFEGIDISLADVAETTAAFLAQSPVGVDIEIIENRNAETWKGLLDRDGYSLARDISIENGETFNTAATRVWTLLEASKKANSLKRRLPKKAGSLGGAWLSFSHITQTDIQEYLCVTLDSLGENNFSAVLTVASSKVNDNEDRVTLDSIAEAYEELEELKNHFRNRMNKFKTQFKKDPQSSSTEKNHVLFLKEIEDFMSGLLNLEHKIGDDEKYQIRQDLVGFFMEFMDGSDVFRFALEKPFGYAGDFLMLDKLVQEDCESTGLAYHFDRSQLEYPASQACRNRIDWVGSELVELAKTKPDKRLKILSIGVGGAPIERFIVNHLPDVKLELDAVDIEPACLEFVKDVLEHENNIVNVHRIDLRRPDAPERLKKLAVNVDVCNFIGIAEALRDEEVIGILSELNRTLPKGTPLYMESFLPDHPSRPYMEWFMDFHLGYRSKEAIVDLVSQSGVPHENMKPSIDESNSLFFLKITV